MREWYIVLTMKIWIKVAIGTIIGILLAVFLPETVNNKNLFAYLFDLIIHIGRYAIFPIVLFSLSMGVYELKREQVMGKIYLRIILYLILTTALLTVIGTFSVLAISPSRIPIIIEDETVYSLPHIKDILLQIFPKNLFQIFISSGNFLFPLYFFAFFLGMNFTFDKTITKPAVEFFDSMSRIFYHINSFIIEVISTGCIALSAHFLFQVREIQEIALFEQLILTLIINSAVIIFGLYPALLYFLGGRKNPYRWLYGIAAPAVIGFLSRDSYFSLSFLIKHGKENLGIPRKIGAAGFPFFAIFGRAGTAMVTSISFIIILKSYSSLGIEISHLLWTMSFAFLLSFLLGTVPGLGTFISLSILCTLYGTGVEEGYLILKPIAPLLISFSVLLDVVTSAFSTYLVSIHEDMNKEVEAVDFI